MILGWRFPTSGELRSVALEVWESILTRHEIVSEIADLDEDMKTKTV